MITLPVDRSTRSRSSRSCPCSAALPSSSSDEGAPELGSQFCSRSTISKVLVVVVELRKRRSLRTVSPTLTKLSSSSDTFQMVPSYSSSTAKRIRSMESPDTRMSGAVGSSASSKALKSASGLGQLAKSMGASTWSRSVNRSGAVERAGAISAVTRAATTKTPPADMTLIQRSPTRRPHEVERDATNTKKSATSASPTGPSMPPGRSVNSATNARATKGPISGLTVDWVRSATCAAMEVPNHVMAYGMTKCRGVESRGASSVSEGLQTCTESVAIESTSHAAPCINRAPTTR